MRLAPLLLAALLVAGCAAGPQVPDRTRAADSHAGVGLHLIAQGRPEQARAPLERALEMVPEHPEALTGMGLLAEAAGEMERARAYHRRAVDAAPESGAIRNNYGRLLCRLGRVDAGVEALQAAAAAEGYAAPEVPLTNAARCLLREGRREEARGWLRKALEAAPDFAPALTARAEAYYLADEYAAAADDLERARAAGGGARTLYWSVRVARAQGEAEAAESYRRRLRERFPDSAYRDRLADDEGAS